MISSYIRPAVIALLRADPNLDAETIDRAMAVLDEDAPSRVPALDIDPVITFDEAVEITRVGKRTLRNWAKDGRIRFIYGGGGRALGVSAESLREFMRRGKPARGVEKPRTGGVTLSSPYNP